MLPHYIFVRILNILLKRLDRLLVDCRLYKNDILSVIGYTFVSKAWAMNVVPFVEYSKIYIESKLELFQIFQLRFKGLYQGNIFYNINSLEINLKTALHSITLDEYKSLFKRYPQFKFIQDSDNIKDLDIVQEKLPLNSYQPTKLSLTIRSGFHDNFDTNIFKNPYFFEPFHLNILKLFNCTELKCLYPMSCLLKVKGRFKNILKLDLSYCGFGLQLDEFLYDILLFSKRKEELQYLSIKGNALGFKGGLKLQQIFKNSTILPIRTLDISNNALGLSLGGIIRNINTNPKLKSSIRELSIAENNFNSLEHSMKTILELSDYIKDNLVLESLDISNNIIQGEVYKLFLNALFKDGSLKRLNIANTTDTLHYMPRLLGHYLGNNIYIEELKMGTNFLDFEGAEVFSLFKRYNLNTLKLLDVSHCAFTNINLLNNINIFIKSYQTLEVLNLAGCNLGDNTPNVGNEIDNLLNLGHNSVLIEFITSCLSLPILKNLNLSQNKLYVSIGHLIAEKLVNNRSLESLNLDNNYLQESCNDIIHAIIPNHTLKILGLSFNFISSSLSKEILADLLIKNETLLRINLSSNFLNSEIGNVIFTSLAKNTKLIEFICNGNLFDYQDFVKNLRALTFQNTSLINLSLTLPQPNENEMVIYNINKFKNTDNYIFE